MKRKVSLLLLISALALTGCASSPFNAAPDAAATPAERLGTLQQQKAAAPDDIALTTAVEFSRQDYVRAELKKADRQVAQGNHAAAIDHLGNVLAEDPGNLKASQALEQVKRHRQMAVDLARAQRIGGEKPQEALEIARRILAEQPNHAEAKRLRDTLLRQSQASRAARPQLSDALRKPVSLNFKQQPLANIFDVISRVSGVNFVFDRDVDTSQAATLFAERTTAEDAINLLLRTNQLEKKVLDQHTLLVYPSQPDKARNYTEFAIRTFFLSHADAKSVMAALRQMIKPKDVYVDERVNAVVMRDTPETIQVAERVVMGLDIPQSEVTLDVQVLEVNMNDSLDLGVQYPGKVQFGALGAAEGGALTLGDLLRLNRDRVGVSSESGGLALAIDMLQKQGKTRTLANPKIRVRNMEKANIKIGERVPIVTTTNANGVVTESVSYQDVGLMLKVEPRISLNEEVSVKVNMEVSSILSKETTKTGLVAYSLGTRNAETLMTAKNGETQILAGLVKRNETDSIAGLPGASGLPVIGRLFGSNGRSNERSEIVLLITPHIERNLDLPTSAVTTFLSGTESRVTTEALTLESAQAVPARQPSSGGPDLDAPIEPSTPAGNRAAAVPEKVERAEAAEKAEKAEKAEAEPKAPAEAAQDEAASPVVEPVARGAGMMRTRADAGRRPAAAIEAAQAVPAGASATPPRVTVTRGEMTRAEVTRAEATRAEVTRAEVTRAEVTRAEVTRAVASAEKAAGLRAAIAAARGELDRAGQAGAAPQIAQPTAVVRVAAPATAAGAAPARTPAAEPQARGESRVTAAVRALIGTLQAFVDRFAGEREAAPLYADAPVLLSRARGLA
ncbi:secretin N-terminal domain-containing protein [Burkholderia stagnalis]|uniref:Secretin n=1 Tax=Burkholderia stagnalis TaxID=1503054 RepID=A0ABX9YEF5_9BURK|nr:secretin N-terminal domain-containing protein [Burkholderia stagnalis]RQQ47273.1 secretin [Burkholderia stagnalis]RQQ59346.1 secretin [Burkholderia stagnalis]RQQ73376.1 secretin [Burkholderia stagnalis]RQQ75388.1 secretin [Burkholderia stagnalis]RQQ97500.1 secretin [Burkholderia stagnalis]